MKKTLNLFFLDIVFHLTAKALLEVKIKNTTAIKNE